MNGFQIVGCAVLLGLTGWTLYNVRTGRLGRGAAVGWATLWLIGLAAILEPELTVRAARAVGVGRGADLVLYLAILGGFVALLLVHTRMRRLEAEITKIVRHIALQNEGGTTERPSRAVNGGTTERQASDSGNR
ncbi:MAG: DUF2304 family protein [Thermoanaerobaculia bacterium]